MWLCLTCMYVYIDIRFVHIYVYYIIYTYTLRIHVNMSIYNYNIYIYAFASMSMCCLVHITHVHMYTCECVKLIRNHIICSCMNHLSYVLPYLRWWSSLTNKLWLGTIRQNRSGGFRFQVSQVQDTPKQEYYTLVPVPNGNWWWLVVCRDTARSSPRPVKLRREHSLIC